MKTLEPGREKAGGFEGPAATTFLLALLGGGGVIAILKLVKTSGKDQGQYDSLWDDYDYGEEDSEEWETEDEESKNRRVTGQHRRR